VQKFRNLTKNIFFKIFLIFIAFTFVGFGMVDIFLGNGNWIIKVGKKTINYDQYVKDINQASSIIYNSNPTQENLKLVKSNQFKTMVLQKTSAEATVKEIRKDFNFSLEKQSLLRNIVKNKSFYDDSEKFNRQYFINFLKFNGITEKSYLQKVQDDIFNKIINKSLQIVVKENEIFSKILYKNYAQSRVIDVIRFYEDSIRFKRNITKNDLKQLYNKNKNLFFFPESRKVSYIEFDKEEFAHQVKISDKEVKEEYDKNIKEFTIPEKRNFYHLLFDNQQKANNFEEQIAKIALNNKNFLKTVKKTLNKEEEDILLKNIFAEDLIKNLRDKSFKLKEGEKTKIIKSDIGYHIFYLTKITKQKVKNLSEVKKEIKKNLEESNKIKHFAKIKEEINESLILDNSLIKISDKFRLKIRKIEGKLSDKSKLDNFWKNTFTLKLNSPSKIFQSITGDKFYIVEVSKVTKKKNKNYQEARVEVRKQVMKNHKKENLQKFISTTNKKLSKNPKYFYQISLKKNLRIDNKEIKQNHDGFDKNFIEKIFSLKKVKTATKITKYGDIYQIAFLKKIKSSFKEKEFNEFKKKTQISLNKEILEEYNEYLRKKYKIRYNKKLLNSILGSKDD
jgi:hypothetical protein